MPAEPNKTELDLAAIQIRDAVETINNLSTWLAQKGYQTEISYSVLGSPDGHFNQFAVEISKKVVL